jgi:hypothetical protein
MRNLGYVLALLVIALSAACGGGDEESADSPTDSAPESTAGSDATDEPAVTDEPTVGDVGEPPDACTLVTAADVTAAVGETALEPPQVDSSTQCDYGSADDFNFVKVRIDRVVSQGFFDQYVQSLSATVEVEDLGDAAYQTEDGGTILVLNGSYELRIDVFTCAVAECTGGETNANIDLEIAQSLATTALSRWD